MESIFSGFRRSSKKATREPVESTASLQDSPDNDQGQSSLNTQGTARSTSQNLNTGSEKKTTSLTEASTQGSNDQLLSDRSQTMRLSKNNPSKTDDDFDLPSEPVTPSAYSSPSSLSKPLGSGNEPTPSAVIGPKISIKGELTGEEDLMIQGRVEGTIDLKGNHLTIGKQGVVKANVMAKTITIQGTVEGDIIGEERVSITASSNVQGNVIAGRVTLEDGAKFRGSIDMESSKNGSSISSSPASTPKASTGSSSAPQQASGSGTSSNTSA